MSSDSESSSSESGSDSSGTENSDLDDVPAVPVVEKKAPPKKKRKKPTGPKKPLTAFVYFSKENRPKIKAANPEANFAEIGRLVGAAWAQCEDRQAYQDLNAQDKIRYQKEVAELPPEDVPKAASRKKAKNNGQPKRALSSYMWFNKEQREIIKKENPTATFAELGKLLGAKWKSLSAEERQPYVDQNTEDKERYARELQAFLDGGGVIQKAVRKKAAPKKVTKKVIKKASESEQDNSDSSSNDQSDSGSSSGSDSDSDSDSSGSGSDTD